MTLSGYDTRERSYQFNTDADAMTSVRMALKAFCDASQLQERARTSFTYVPGDPTYDGRSKATLFSQDQGDFILFRYDTLAPWVGILDIDVNQNGVVDSGDVEYGNQGSNACDVYATSATRTCNEFHSSAKPPVITRDQRQGYFAGHFGVETTTSVTRVIPKAELSTKEPFVMVLLRAYSPNTKQIDQSGLVKIPFAMAPK